MSEIEIAKHKYQTGIYDLDDLIHDIIKITETDHQQALKEVLEDLQNHAAIFEEPMMEEEIIERLSKLQDDE